MKESPSYTVLLTASGSGAGMGELTKYTNKTLLRLGDKPAISYIIDSYPKNTEFIVTLGHFGLQVKEYLTIAYPKHNFKFIEIKNYDGLGSGLGQSMYAASSYLNKPFIFHASDTIVFDKIPRANCNWIGGYVGTGSSNYTSFNILNGKIQKILEKGIIDPDYLHIGLVGIFDYKSFWKSLKILLNSNQTESISDFHVLNELIYQSINFQVKEFKDWYDVGNIESLKKAREKIHDKFNILDKPEESIFFLNKKVYKFFYNTEYVNSRVNRARMLNKLVPKIKDVTNHFYTYPYIEGELFSEIVNSNNIESLLNWAIKNLWIKSSEVNNYEFKKVCYKFYFYKTKDRIKQFVESRGVGDILSDINGMEVPDTNTILSKINFDWLSDTDQRYFHGDFILDNIIKTKTGFKLIDWRQDFGGLLKSGDMYYDLAKLNHSLTVNHKIVNDNLFQIIINNNKITCDIHRLNRLVQSETIYHNFLIENNLSTKKIKILTGLIWLNMAPLHHHPFDLFLFYFGKYYLWEVLKNNV